MELFGHVTSGMEPSGRRSWWAVWGFTASLVVAGASTSSAQTLPPGGTTKWEMSGIEEVLTFVLFDPASREVSLPKGLRFVAAKDTGMPEIVDYLKTHPECAEWAFSFVEITREKSFVIDGRSPKMPKDGGIGLWLAPVDPSGIAEEIGQEMFDGIIASSLGSVLGLAVWVPDREYVDYMRSKGHHADYGMVTLTKASDGALRGEIRLDNLKVVCSAKPQGEVTEDPELGTQVMFAPGPSVAKAVVIAGGGARNQACEATWSKDGAHALARGVFVGPTYFTTYAAPLKGSAYPLGPEKK